MNSMLRCLLLLACLVASSEAFGGGGTKAPKKVAMKAAVKKAAPKPKPVKKAVVKKAAAGSPESDIGVTPPLGLFDPLNFLSRGPDAYRRYQEIEIKHGRP